MIYAIALMIAFVISYSLTFPTIILARKLKLVTDKRKRFHPAHTHTGIIPRAGGLPIYLSILIPSLILLPLNKIIITILVTSFLLVLSGLFDDYYDLSPYLRFGLNILIAALVIGAGLGIPYISSPFGGIIRLDQFRFGFSLFGKHSFLVFADLLAILWLVWTTNMVNWSKGVDGQLPGFVAITAFF